MLDVTKLAFDNEPNAKRLAELYPDEDIYAAVGYDEAILGFDERRGVVCYSSEKILDILRREMSDEEALEYFEFNIAGAMVGEKTPTFVRDDEFKQ